MAAGSVEAVGAVAGSSGLVDEVAPWRITRGGQRDKKVGKDKKEKDKKDKQKKQTGP